MDAKELRIGNWVKDTTGIYNVYITGHYLFEMERGEMDVLPIILTPEILEACGFEWDIYWQGSTDGNWVLTEGELGYRLAYGKRRHDIIKYGIKYVHQLQNLIYALTGEELTIKL